MNPGMYGFPSYGNQFTQQNLDMMLYNLVGF